MARLSNGESGLHLRAHALISIAELRVGHPPISHGLEGDGHQINPLARSNASSIRRLGVFDVFFMNAATMTTRVPFAVTYKALPSLPLALARISQSFP